MPMPAGPIRSVAQLVEAAKIDPDTQRARHGPLMELPRRMLGVEPNCHPYLEIWPIALRSYNLLIPNFLNMPFSMWGLGIPPRWVGLAMYVSSRAAQCMYCSAHGCSFAMRRGLPPEILAAALDPDATRSDAERAVIAVAQGMSSMPATLTDDDLAELRREFSPAHADWIVLVVIMMGFLNKCMDTLGVDLERAVVEDVRGVISRSGWTPGRHGVRAGTYPTLGLRPDSLGRKLALVPLLPRAILSEVRVTRGVPKAWPQVGRFLAEHTGHGFEGLSGLRPSRVVRALTTVLRDNLGAEHSALGLPTKLLAGLLSAAIIGNDEVVRTSRALLEAQPEAVGAAVLDTVADWGRRPVDFDDDEALGSDAQALATLEGLDDAAIAALLFAKAASQTPSCMTPALLARCGPALSPEAVIELVAWVSILQLLHRLTLGFAAAA